MRAKGKTEADNRRITNNVKITEDLDARLGKVAFKLDVTKMDVMRHAIRALVEAIEQKDYEVSWPPNFDIQSSAREEELIRKIAREEFFRQFGKGAFHEEVLRAAEDESPYPAPRKSTPPVHPPTQRP